MKLRFKKKIKDQFISEYVGLFKRYPSFKSCGILSRWNECEVPDREKAIDLLLKRLDGNVMGEQMSVTPQKSTKVNSDGSIDVIVQDNTSEAIDIYLCNNKGTTNPTVAVAIDDKTVTVADTTGAVVGDCIDLKEGKRFFQSIVTNITGSVVTFASPCDAEYTTAAQVCFGEWDLAQANGSVTPVVYCMAPPPDAQYDIYSLTISMVDGSAMDDSKFGGIAALTNGLVGRRTDGTIKQLFLISNNAGFREYGFNIEYPLKPPAGKYAVAGEKLFPTKNGTVLRLNGKTLDTIDVTIQDDLTGLEKFSIVAHGHEVE